MRELNRPIGRIPVGPGLHAQIGSAPQQRGPAMRPCSFGPSRSHTIAIHSPQTLSLHMRPYFLFALFLFAGFIRPVLATAPSDAQDLYDETVGYAYGYVLMASRIGEKCVELYPDTSESVHAGLAEWKGRNAEAIAEIDLQWNAYVDRDSVVARLPRSSYAAFIERQIPGAIARTFAMYGGFRSSEARARCAGFGLMLLNDPTFRLERKMEKELKAFRACANNGTCPNIKRSQ